MRRIKGVVCLDSVTLKKSADDTEVILGSAGVSSATFDYENNRLVSVSTNGAAASTVLYDAAGNVTSMVNRAGVALSLAWNTLGQLVSVSTNGAFAESYAYGPLGRRTSTTSLSTTNHQPSTIDHLYDGDRCAADTDASGNLLRAYTWGPGVDNLLAVTVYASGSTNSYYAVKDRLGSVHALVDASGNVAAQFTYDAWGSLTASTPNSSFLTPNFFLFHGGVYSAATGLYQFRARWYSPELGRWLSPDPIGLEGGLNLYEFCRNNPVNFRDPSGLISGWILASVGAATSVGAYYIGSLYSGTPTTAGGVLGALVSGAIAGATAGVFVGDPSALAAASVAWGVIGGATGGALGGAVGSVVQQGIDTGKVCIDELMHDTAIGALGGAIAGGIGGSMLKDEAAWKSLLKAASVSGLSSAAITFSDNLGAQIHDLLNPQQLSIRNDPDYVHNLETMGKQ